MGLGSSKVYQVKLALPPITLAERLIEKAEKEKDILKKLSYYLKAITQLRQAAATHADVKNANSWIKKIVGPIISAYNQIFDQYQNQNYLTYQKAWQATILMEKTQRLLPHCELKQFSPIQNYPKLIDVFELKKLLAPIASRLKPLVLEPGAGNFMFNAYLFSPSKYKKVCLINRAFNTAFDHFKTSIVDLESFVTYRNNDGSSLVNALQKGRIGPSGRHVGSFRKFVHALDKYAPGLGTSIKHLSISSPCSHAKIKLTV